MPATILIVFALVFFVIAAIWEEPYRIRLVAAGLAAYMGSILIGRF
jgi:hypothetical protein